MFKYRFDLNYIILPNNEQFPPETINFNYKDLWFLSSRLFLFAGGELNFTVTLSVIMNWKHLLLTKSILYVCVCV